MPENKEQQLKELKADAYDHLALIEYHQKHLVEINAQIQQMTKQLQKEKKIPVFNNIPEENQQ